MLLKPSIKRAIIYLKFILKLDTLALLLPDSLSNIPLYLLLILKTSLKGVLCGKLLLGGKRHLVRTANLELRVTLKALE
jgi:hypothetical protein